MTTRTPEQIEQFRDVASETETRFLEGLLRLPEANAVPEYLVVVREILEERRGVAV